ncbi:MAG: tRNA epoxyqueuosine(34) reductase QueG [Gemmatimonadales bacterium]
MSLRAALEQEAARLEFLAVGVATLEPSRYGPALDAWLARGFGGTMRYLHRQAARRKEPARIQAGATRAIVVLDNYAQPRASLPPGAGPAGDGAVTGTAEDAGRRCGPEVRIAQYARGRDYHLDLTERLEHLADWVRGQGATIARSFADAGPVPERELAMRAGLGWIGKNTMLIRPGVGSLFFIGTVFTDLDLEPDPAFEPDHCGTCTRCLDACPTAAIVEPRVLDATRCISYLTIESKTGPSADLVPRLAGWAFGCDICNDVCPWNERFAEPTGHAAYRDRGAVDRSDPGYFDRLGQPEFAERFGDTPFERPGLERMRRNFANAFSSLLP